MSSLTNQTPHKNYIVLTTSTDKLFLSTLLRKYIMPSTLPLATGTESSQDVGYAPVHGTEVGVGEHGRDRVVGKDLS